MAEALQYLGAMFGAGSVPVVSAEAMYYLKNYGVIFVLAIVGATPIVKRACAWTETKMCAKGAASVGTKLLGFIEFAVLAALLIAATAFLVDGSFNPFLYFRF